MNIFYLDKNLQKAAEYHVDKHVVKMITEHNQLLCYVHHLTDSNWKPKNLITYNNIKPNARFAVNLVPYSLSKTHARHPNTLWVKESIDNYMWLVEFNQHLCKEYTYRYGKIHAGEKITQWCLDHIPSIPNVGFTKFALSMPIKYKCQDPVQSYRNYYNGDKRHLFKWTKRDVPKWIKDK